MDDTRKILADRVKALVEQDARSPRAISMEATGKPDTVRDILRGKSVPANTTLADLARTLGTTTDYLLGRAGSPAQVLSEVTVRDFAGITSRSELGGLPLVATGYCDDLIADGNGEEVAVERLQLEMDNIIRMIERPAALASARDAYAIYFHGSSMEPRFYANEIGVVDPRLPPGPGDFVVAQLSDEGSDDIATILVKQLVRQSSREIVLRQFNPEAIFTVPRSRIVRLHRIMGLAELLGG